MRFPGLRRRVGAVGGLTGSLGSGQPVGLTGLRARSKSDDAGGVKAPLPLSIALIVVVAAELWKWIDCFAK